MMGGGRQRYLIHQDLRYLCRCCHLPTRNLWVKTCLKTERWRLWL